MRRKKRLRGRPSYRPTVAVRAKVRMLKGMGWSHVRIAEVIDITPPTLEKHFREELDRGADIELSISMGKLRDKMMAGELPAIREYIKKIEAGSAVDVFLREPEKPAVAATSAPPKLGKKEQAREHALRAAEGSDWGDDLAPIGRPN